MSRLALEVKGLNFSYEKVSVLWDICLNIPGAQIIAIVGPNGGGKTTLLKAVLSIEKPLSGNVYFWGRRFKEMRKKIAYVPQKDTIDWDFPITVFNAVLMGRYGNLGCFKRVRSADKMAAEYALEVMGMLEYKDRQISKLSAGEQQKLFIARALLQDPDIYFMDEPLANVDISTEKKILEILQKLKSKEKTVFIVHHDLSSVKNYFDWVIMLNRCLIASGKVEDVFTIENIHRCFGKNRVLLDEAAKLSQEKYRGIDVK